MIDVQAQASKIAPGPRIDKASLAIATPRRFRDKAHLRAVSAKPCLICGRQPSHAHHLKFAQSHGLAQKVSDEFVVPLCSIHHDELHRAATELEWWRTQGIDPLPVASELWKNARQGREIASVPGHFGVVPTQSDVPQRAETAPRDAVSS